MGLKKKFLCFGYEKEPYLHNIFLTFNVELVYFPIFLFIFSLHDFLQMTWTLNVHLSHCPLCDKLSMCRYKIIKKNKIFPQKVGSHICSETNYKKKNVRGSYKNRCTQDIIWQFITEGFSNLSGLLIIKKCILTFDLK